MTDTTMPQDRNGSASGPTDLPAVTLSPDPAAPRWVASRRAAPASSDDQRLCHAVDQPLGSLINALQAALWSLEQRADLQHAMVMLQRAADAAEQTAAIVREASGVAADLRREPR